MTGVQSPLPSVAVAVAVPVGVAVSVSVGVAVGSGVVVADGAGVVVADGAGVVVADGAGVADFAGDTGDTGQVTAWARAVAVCAAVAAAATAGVVTAAADALGRMFVRLACAAAALVAHAPIPALCTFAVPGDVVARGVLPALARAVPAGTAPDDDAPLPPAMPGTPLASVPAVPAVAGAGPPPPSTLPAWWMALRRG